jgi:GTP-binding protein HflX
VEKFRQTLRVRKERAILVAAVRRGGRGDLDELASLAESAGAIVVDRFRQKIGAVNPSTYIGRGKAKELSARVKRFSADVLIFDNDLSPGQIRELEKAAGTKVVDRSELILDIFAGRARTRQARLQVELAQLEYTYPRLTRMWGHLDTLAGAGGGTAAGAVGGIGTRGPGEQQLEIDRRLVNRRIAELRTELAVIDRRRVREIDARESLFKICLVGYTNAGKSTLMNALTEAGVLVEDRLFATLDTRTRKWFLEGAIVALLSDTVGFIRDLPHQLVASFKATLEEAVNADMLLHVVDVSRPDALDQADSVDAVLKEIGCSEKPLLRVLNKIDMAGRVSTRLAGVPGGGMDSRAASTLEMLESLFPEAVCISAKTGNGLADLRRSVLARYRGTEVLVRVAMPLSDGRVQSFLNANGRVLSREYNGQDVLIDAYLGRNQLAALRRLKPAGLEMLTGGSAGIE